MLLIDNPTTVAALHGVPPTTSRSRRASGTFRLASRFHRQHLWWPLAASTVLSFVLMGLHGDLWLADALYAWEGNAWSLQSGHLTQGLLHLGGRHVVKYVWLGVLLLLLLSFKHRSIAGWRWPLAYLLASTLFATLLVGVMKRWTHMDCPWDLMRYGGEKAYYGLFTSRPAGMRSSGCFPAGHASAGYAWVALYFVLLATRPQWRWWGLGVGICLGLLFGIAQQLRGAHFMSHDLWALMVSWLIALVLYCGLLAPRRRRLIGKAST